MATATKTRRVVGWSGLVLPYGVSSPVGDQRVVLKSRLDPPHRKLPLPVKLQERSAPGHDNARQGLALITRVWETPDGLWASGTIDTDDPAGAEFARKLEQGFLGWISADIETDGGGYERNSAGRQVPTFRTWRLAGATLVADSAFENARIEPVYDVDEITPVEQVRAEYATFSATVEPHMIAFSHGDRRRAEFVVTGDVDLPWAPRDRSWDEQAASDRVWSWADGDTDRLARAHLYRDPDADPETKTAYKLGFADVIDGRLHAVYRAVASAAGYLDRADIPPDERDRIRSRIDTLYGRAADAFDDPTIDERNTGMSGDDDSRTEEMQEEEMPPMPEASDVTISASDVQRIADAVVAALDARDSEVEAEFARVSGVHAALGMED